MRRMPRCLAKNRKRHDDFRPLRPRGRDHRRQWRHRARYRAGARGPGLQRLDLGPQCRQEQGSCRERGGPGGQGRYPRLRRHRSRLGQRCDEGDARHFRPGRRLLRQCRHRRRRPTLLHRAHGRGMAHDVCDQPRRRVPRIPNRREAHDRARQCRRSLRPSGCDLEPRLDFRHGAQRALCRDQGRHQRAGARARRRVSPATASPPMRSCPAGSRAT